MNSFSKFCAPLIAFSFLLNAPLQSEERSASLWDYHPLHLGSQFIYIGKASLQSPETGTLQFNKTNVYLNMLVPVASDTFFFPNIAWNGFTLNWNQNPKFNQTHFDYAQFGLLFYTTAIEDWRWILRAEYNIDLQHFSRPGLYGLFSGLAWGTQQINEKWHYHIGFLGYVGMRGNLCYPLIGFGYAPRKEWLIQAIFPMEYSVQYKMDRWRFAIQGRPLKERFRAGGNEPQPRSIFNYSSMGAEFNIKYEIERRFEFEVYAGYNFGGNFYIKSQYGKQALYTKFDGAPYTGFKIEYAF